MHAAIGERKLSKNNHESSCQSDVKDIKSSETLEIQYTKDNNGEKIEAFENEESDVLMDVETNEGFQTYDKESELSFDTNTINDDTKDKTSTQKATCLIKNILIEQDKSNAIVQDKYYEIPVEKKLSTEAKSGKFQCKQCFKFLQQAASFKSHTTLRHERAKK